MMTVPTTEYAIPSGWERVSLGDLCERMGGSVQTGPFGSQLHAEDYKDDGTPIITVEHLGDGEIVHRNLPLVGPEDAQRLSKYALRAGDLVFSRVGAIDRCALVTKKENGWLFSGRCLRVRASGADVVPRFLSGTLNHQTARRWIINHAVGSTMACLNTKILSGVPIQVPPPIEQVRIAEVLATLDETIRGTREMIVKNNAIYQGLQTRFFGASAAPAREGWQETQLEDIAESITSGPRGWAMYYAEAGDYFLRIGNLTRKHLDLRFEDVVKVQPPAGAEGVRTALSPGDLLISITADLGIIGVVPDWMGIAYINQHIARARLNRSKVNPRFLGYQLAGQVGQKQFYRLNDVGAKAGLNLPTVGRLKVWLPPLPEQDRLVMALDTLQKKLREDEALFAKLEGLKSGLTSDLLTGRVRTVSV